MCIIKVQVQKYKLHTDKKIMRRLKIRSHCQVISFKLHRYLYTVFPLFIAGALIVAGLE